jgi:hypothetical protein
MRDLTSTGWIIAKGILLGLIALLAAAELFAEQPSLRRAALLAVLVWAGSRFYYFLFYVLERYVDPALRYAGLTALARTIWQRRRSGGGS